MSFVKRALTIETLICGISFVLTSPGLAVISGRAVGQDRAGAVYEISRDVKTLGRDGKGSTNSSTDHSILIERVVQIRADGLILEYSLPSEHSVQDQSGDWEFPLRVFKPLSGAPRLLNQSEMDNRIGDWLKKSGLPRSACGHWVFTWSAYKVSCDPQSALTTIRPLDLRLGDLRDGSLYQDPEASGPIKLQRSYLASGGGTRFLGEAPVDIDRVRNDQAEADVAVAEITGKSLELDDALRARSREKVSGTVSIIIDVDPAGFAIGRTKVVTLSISATSGAIAERTTTETVKRRMITEATAP